MTKVNIIAATHALNHMSDPSLTILLVDHQDSFSQTIAAEFEALGAKVHWVEVGRGNEQFSGEWEALCTCDGVVLSPGPGHPDEYGNLWLREWLMAKPHLPTFGICLGLQILLHWSGVRISQIAAVPVHGRVGPLSASGSCLPQPFAAIDPESQVVSYNSLGCPWNDFLAHENAWEAVPNASQQGYVNLAAHRALPWCGVQFHPESFATPNGTDFFAAFLELCKTKRAQRETDGT